jgi:hypothetical protein
VRVLSNDIELAQRLQSSERIVGLHDRRRELGRATLQIIRASVRVSRSASVRLTVAW